MKKLLLILLFLPTIGFCQTKINRSQIEESVFRPEAGVVLSGPTPTVTFDVPHKQQTLDVDEDMVLTLNGSGNVANSRIDIIATGDGTHVLTFPTNWKMKGDAYDVNSVNEIQLRYNSAGVIGEITNQSAIDVLTTSLTSAIVTNEVPTQLNLTFNEPVNATDDGWSLTASAAAVDIEGVSGSGTINIVFNLSRAILYSETVTVSYGETLTGGTFDLAGFELDNVVDFPVTVPTPPPPVTQNCDITYCPSGCDFTTPQAAHDAAVDGDVICGGNGTYRQTVTVTKNNLTFTNITGETPIHSGFELVGTTGWTVHSGNIYKKTITLPVNGFNTQSTAFSGNVVPNTTILANQIIRNGEMMIEARYPNITGFSQLNKWENFKQYNDAQGFKYNQLNDAALPLTPPALVGATIVSNGWYIAYARTITAHDNSGPGGVERVTYANIREAPPANGQWMRRAYYITGKLGLLDAEQEWHYESGTLYFWQPGGGTPTGTIEHKARNWGFDVRGQSGTQIIGLTFTGVDPVIGDASSINTVVDGTTATYNNHHVRHDYGKWHGLEFGMASQLGTRLLGANSVFKNNTWSRSGSISLWMGPNCRVENNTIFDTGYSGNQAGALAPWGNDGGQIITRNTIYNQGKGCIFFGSGNHSNMEISYNHFYDFGTVDDDGGGTYAGNGTRTTGLNYHHNWIHGNRSRTDDFGLQGGIYFDQDTGPGTIHHNVLWDINHADIYHQIITSSSLFNIYNNTFAATNVKPVGQEASYKCPVTTPLDVQRNNIYVRRININWTSSIGNNQNYILQGTNPVFINPSGTSGLDYRIQTTSPAKDAGQVIPGITDGFVGAAPDIGAYEFGGEDWVPGASAVPTDGTVNDDEWTRSLNWVEKNDAPQVMIDGDIWYTTTLTSTATFVFTNSKAKFYLEGCDNHGVAKLEVLDNTMAVIATHNLDTYVNTGGTTGCGTGTQIEYEFTGLAAGTKTARVTFESNNPSATPARTSIALDGGRFYD